MKKLCLHPMFVLGLAIRLGLIFGLAPLALTEWYVPFLDASASNLAIDPWSAWLGTGGATAAFPYGYAMWFTFLPLTLAAKLTGLPIKYAYELTLLAADFCLLTMLYRLLPGRRRLLLVSYWLSPIVILATYGLGLNDIVPALLLFASIYYIRHVDLRKAGIYSAAAISAKLSMVVAWPFFVIYLYNMKALRARLPEFLQGFLVCGLALGVPFAFSAGGLQMMFGNPEMGKIYELAINVGQRFSVYVVPLVYLVMLYLAWRTKRLNFDLFQATISIAFLLIVLMTPASPGWFVWSIPFLALYQAMSGRLAIALIAVFSTLYVITTLLLATLRLENGTVFSLGGMMQVSEQAGNHIASLLHTSLFAVGAILAMRMWREAISQNDFFRLSRKPFVIGIAGDSGAGKDTFAQAVEGLFGAHSVAKLSGDDYHLWDRQKPMWQVMTHLNPMANDLEAFCNDLISLADGKSIHSRHYDHRTGRMGRPLRVKSNDIIIASGLHALYLPLLRDCYNLKIYLDIDEGLRRYFKLRRDVLERGHTVERVLASIDKRAADSERFIRPQVEHADLVLSLQPIHLRMLEDFEDKSPIRMKLVARTQHGLNVLSLNRVLVGVCGLRVDIVVSDDGSQVQMSIEGEPSAADISLAAEMTCPRVMEFLDIPPKWMDGMFGLMQLITLSHISQAMTKRFI